MELTKLDAPKERWRDMPALRMLLTIGLCTGGVVGLAYITNSAATGFEYLLALPFAAFGLGFVMGLGTFAVGFSWLTLELLLAWVGEERRARIYFGMRWAVAVTSISGVLLLGGQLILDGLFSNRLVDQKTLYERCMTPLIRTVREEYRTCRDGWSSASIGRRGACSHHGGVVRRWIEREKTYQNEPAYCRVDSARRSWLE